MIADCGHIYTEKLLGLLERDNKAGSVPKPLRRSPRGTQQLQAPLNIELDDLEDDDRDQ
ncbi:MAG: hypothetical protein KJO07_18765 [Deltaproteobacteria bacterium]|nr:hypothetical protein [Deltaproteobacteria bacterium]